MKLLIILLSVLVFISGCSTQNIVNPPISKVLSLIERDLISKNNILVSNISGLPDNQKWSRMYLSASLFQKESKFSKACTLFSELKNIEKFPLKNMALIKSIELCPYTKTELQNIWKTIKVNEWEKEKFAEVSVKKALKHKSYKYISKFAEELFTYKKSINEKVKYIGLAIKYSAKKRKLALRKKLYSTAPRFNPQITSDNIYKIARDFEGIRNFNKARRLYKRIIRGNSYQFNEKIKSYNRFRLSYKLERKRKAYLLMTKKMSNFVKKYIIKDNANPDHIKEWINTRITYARVLWTENNQKQSMKVLSELLTFGLESNDEAKVYHLISSIYLENRDYKKSYQYLQKANNLYVTNQKLKDEIKWSMAWVSLLSGNNKNSIAILSSLKNNTKNQQLAKKAAYWEAVSLRRIGKKDIANYIFEDLAENYPFNYYGIISHKEINKMLPTLSNTTKVVNKDEFDLPEFNWLVAMNESNIAKKYLDSYTKKMNKINKLEQILPLYRKVKSHSSPIFLLAKVRDTERKNKILNQSAAYIFPSGHKTDVLTASKQFKIDQRYIYSIIRQESGFLKNVKSHAEAYGLMQLTPETAKEVSNKHNINFANINDLYNPKTNIMLGTAYLSEMKQKFNNRFISYISSYNTDFKKVKIWEKTRFDKYNEIKSIEMIPYEETRNYVKLVLRNIITYYRISSQSDIYFPENLLRGKSL